VQSLLQWKSNSYYKGWRTKCHTIDCARNTFLLLQKHLTSGTELILIGWKIVPNEKHVQCDHRFASQRLANEPLHSSQLSDTVFRKRAAQLHYVYIGNTIFESVIYIFTMAVMPEELVWHGF